MYSLGFVPLPNIHFPDMFFLGKPHEENSAPPEAFQTAVKIDPGKPCWTQSSGSLASTWIFVSRIFHQAIFLAVGWGSNLFPSTKPQKIPTQSGDFLWIGIPWDENHHHSPPLGRIPLGSIVAICYFTPPSNCKPKLLDAQFTRLILRDLPMDVVTKTRERLVPLFIGTYHETASQCG